MKKTVGVNGEDIFEDDGTPGADVAAFATGRASNERLVLLGLAGAIAEGAGRVAELAMISREFITRRAKELNKGLGEKGESIKGGGG